MRKLKSDNNAILQAYYEQAKLGEIEGKWHELIEKYKNKVTILCYNGHSDEKGLRYDISHEANSILYAEAFDYLTSCSNLYAVFINGCYSDYLAEEIFHRTSSVKLVISYSGTVPDQAAGAFQIELFKHLIAGETINISFRLAMNRSLHGEQSDDDNVYRTHFSPDNHEGKWKIHHKDGTIAYGNRKLLEIVSGSNKTPAPGGPIVKGEEKPEIKPKILPYTKYMLSFGSTAIGKTCLHALLIRGLELYDNRYLAIPANIQSEGFNIIEEALYHIFVQKKFPPPSTHFGEVVEYHINFSIENSDKNKNFLNICFLEIAGEDFDAFSLKTPRKQLSTSVNNYLSSAKEIIFFLVTSIEELMNPEDTARRNVDNKFHNFITHLYNIMGDGQKKKFKILIVLSKIDQYEEYDDKKIDDILESKLPRTLIFLRRTKNRLRYLGWKKFSVGKVEEQKTTTITNPTTSYAEEIIKVVYGKITPKKWFQKIFNQ